MTAEDFLRSDEEAAPQSAADFLKSDDFSVPPINRVGVGVPSQFSEGLPPSVPPPQNPNYGLLKSVAEDKARKLPEFLTGSVLLPFSFAGKELARGAEDVGAVIGGNPEGFGNLGSKFNPENPEEKTPFQETVAETSKTNPKSTVAAKIAAGVTENAPMMTAGLPEGVVGRLIALGFTGQMIKQGGDAATILGTELGKNPEDRNHDAITSAISDLSQAGVFSGLAGKHALRKTVDATVKTPEPTKESETQNAPNPQPIEEGGKPEHQGTAPRENIPENQEQVREKESGQAGGGDSPVGAAQEPSVQPVQKVTEGIDFGNIERPHAVGVEKGLSLKPEDVPTLKAEQDASNAAMKDALTKGDDPAFKAAFGKSTFLSGVIEGAQKSGPNYDLYMKEKAASPKQATGGGSVDYDNGVIKPEEVKPVQPETSQKYRVGTNPTLHTLVEKLPASEVEIANGEQPVKVKNDKTGEISTVLQSDLTPVKESGAPKGKKQSIPEKLKSLGYSDSEISAMDKPGQKAIADRGFPKGQSSRGPGAAAAGEPGTYSAIQQLADQMEATSKENAPVNEKISAIEKLKAKASDVKDGIHRGLANVLAINKALWDSYSKLTPYTDMKRIVGKWFYANQKSDFEARQFGKQIIKAVPDKIRREAITNWIQADGDSTLLKEREAASTGSLKQGYKIAQNLTPREIEIAQLIREYYDRQLEKGINEGLLKEGLENYISQVWKKENPVTRKLQNELVNSKLQPNFKFARQRIFNTFFEGEQLGYKPMKDAGALVANYDQSFNKALAARAFIKDLHEGAASDGRPLVEVSGNGRIIEQTGNSSIEQPKSILINPKAKPDEIADYRTIDHPALRGWKYAATAPDGSAVLLKGDMLVHPEIYAKLKNRLSTSWFRQHPVPRAVLNLQSTLKQSMMSISGFHTVQENLHALGHRINPFNLEKIDYSEPITKSLVEHGLQLSDHNALEQFGEGLSAGKILDKVPFLGEKLKAYNDWLFQDNIPRLKLTMAKHALERNMERYADAIKDGKITPDQVLELTSSQANHAFGELPYKYWGRNPNLQDFYRTFLLAPDFLEARAGFVGQALKPGGLGAKGLLKNEQIQALALLALTQYITARIVNQIVDKDPHWETKNAFRIISGNHAYSLRTVPGDIIHLLSDTRGFAFNRLSPIFGRGAIEMATQRDYRGVKRDFFQQLGDLLKSGIPISLSRKNGNTILESFGNALGIQNQHYDAVQNIQQKVENWKESNGIVSPYETVYNPDEDKFAALRNAIQDGRQSIAQTEFDKLKKTIPVADIYKHFKLSLDRPFTGSEENDKKFFNTLSDEGKIEFKEAKDLRAARLRAVYSLH